MRSCLKSWPAPRPSPRPPEWHRGDLRVELGERLGGAELRWVEVAHGPGLPGGWVDRRPAEQGRRARGWAGDDAPAGAVPLLDEGRWDAAAVAGVPHGTDVARGVDHDH